MGYDIERIMKGKFEIRVSRNGKYYFVLKARNGHELVRSEMYESKSACENGIASVQKNAHDAEIVEV